MKKTSLILSSILLTILILSACSTPASADFVENRSNNVVKVSPSDSSASNDPAIENQDDQPDYGIVFPQENVNEITISITPENWQTMLDDMTEIYGEQGSGQKAGPEGRPGLPPADGERPALPAGDRAKLPPARINPGEGGIAKMGGADDQNPVWVEAEVSFNETSWAHVGIRFKGNSSLRSTWGSGSIKLPFKLDFDEFEDQYPETEDQRFYGFKQLSFASGFHDDSRLREKIAADIFREAGVPSAQTAFYAVHVDYGEGPIYLGLYIAVEVVDDTLIETQFSDDSGNVYKPEGFGATFTAGSFSEESFDKETNQDDNDYSDILTLFDILHDQSRLSDPESWRQGLESVFDVDTFLNWLAVNTVIQNWDTYGGMQHNYYLYNNPETEQLTWIPWDNNESLKSGGGLKESLLLNLDSVGDNWPLISYLRDDPVYYQQYQDHLNALLEGGFNLEKMADTYQYYHNLIAPYVLTESEEFTLGSSQQDFERSVGELIEHTRERIIAAEIYLSAP